MTQRTLPELRIAPTISELNNRLCEKIAQVAEESCARRGRFSLVLSGGSTPKALYETLAGETWRSRIPWLSLRLYLGDERCVDENSDESNFRMIREALIKHVPIDEEHIFHPVGQAENPEFAALDYERRIREETKTAGLEFPVFDLVLLGLGDDGHTASLFPG
ncbi:MAG: 6-phosphogluconolactonase, partial [Cyanobacteria bacterium]|nr:6-phosphogluconolactonase [Cyanobacteriota bacterium]